MTLDIREEFLNFLITNNCLEAFISNENSGTQISRDVETLNIISQSFTYIYTKEDPSFWSHLAFVWHSYIRDKKSTHQIEMYSLKEIFKYLKEYQKSEHIPLYW